MDYGIHNIIHKYIMISNDISQQFINMYVYIYINMLPRMCSGFPVANVFKRCLHVLNSSTSGLVMFSVCAKHLREKEKQTQHHNVLNVVVVSRFEVFASCLEPPGPTFCNFKETQDFSQRKTSTRNRRYKHHNVDY